MIPVIVKWIEGSPEKFMQGHFIIYADGEGELVGADWTPAPKTIAKHTTIIEPHELDWLKYMAAGRSLGVVK